MGALKPAVILLLFVSVVAGTQFAWSQASPKEGAGIWVKKLHDCDGEKHSDAQPSRFDKQCQDVSDNVMADLMSKGLLVPPAKARYFIRFGYDREISEVPGSYEGELIGGTFYIGPTTLSKFLARVYWSENPAAVNWENTGDWFLLSYPESARLMEAVYNDGKECTDLAFKTCGKEMADCAQIRSPRSHDDCLERAVDRYHERVEKCEENAEIAAGRDNRKGASPQGAGDSHGGL